MIRSSRLPLPDLLREALAGLLQRPSRSLLTMLGTVLGVGASVAVLGLTATAGGQIDKRFTDLAATEVVIEDVGSSNPADTALSFPEDAATRIESLNGVVHAGLWWPVSPRAAQIGAVPDMAMDAAGLTITAVEPTGLSAMHPKLREGRLYDRFHNDRGERVALLGAAAASRLGITRLDGYPAVFVDQMPYTVLGVVEDFERMPELLFSIIIPTATALADYGVPTGQRAKMLVETKLGAAELIASQAPLALRPDLPARIKAVVPQSPQVLRSQVANDLDTLFLLLALTSLVVGAVGIANTTLVSVLERTGEIGLRRALGARPRHVAAQFLTESTTLGLLGGMVGGGLGTTVVVSVALGQQWTAIIAPWTVLGAPLLGAGVGLVAGTYPAVRAAMIAPNRALRR